MKKLMLTTAIASVLTTAAIAQTTITGELRVSYKAVSADRGLANTGAVGTSKDTSYGFGSEQQINIQNKGKLKVGGLDYAAGFAIENDGEQITSLFNENVYFDFINAPSGTTLSIGRDHIQRSDSDRSATNLVGFTPNELSQTTNKSNEGTRFNQTAGPGVSQQFGFGVLQAIPNIGTFSANYVPNNASPSTTLSTADRANLVASTGDVIGTAGSEAVNPNTTSAYEVGFVGSLGVKGLEVAYFQSENNDFANVIVGHKGVKAEGKNFGAKYNFGSFTVGANRKEYNGEAATLSETKETSYAAAMAINPDLSIGVLYAKAEVNGAGATNPAVDQKIKAVNLGYNLGPVALAAGYARNEDAGGNDGADNDVFMLRLLGAF
jgi:hypothetical protein